jgi:hypothetical protein
MANTDLAIIFTTRNFAEAEILKAMLEAEGIWCRLEGEHQASLTGILEIRGLTRVEDQERARKLLGPHPHHRDDYMRRAPDDVGPTHPQVDVAQAVSSRKYTRQKTD